MGSLLRRCFFGDGESGNDCDDAGDGDDGESLRPKCEDEGDDDQLSVA